MPVQTRSQTRSPKETVTPVPQDNDTLNQVFVEINEYNKETSYMTTNGVTFTNTPPDDNWIEGPVKYTYRISISYEDVHPRYRESLPDSITSREKDMFAIAPRGYYWKEEDRCTRYFAHDEYWTLHKFPKDNIYYYDPEDPEWAKIQALVKKLWA